MNAHRRKKIAKMLALKNLEVEKKAEQPKTQLGLKKIEVENKVEESAAVAVAEQKLEEVVVEMAVEQKMEESVVETIIEPSVELQEGEKPIIAKKKKNK